MEEEIIVKLEPVRDDIGVQESEGAAHAGVKQHTCNTCGKSLSQSHHLTEHIGSVNLCMRFKCEHSKKNFTGKRGLTIVWGNLIEPGQLYLDILHLNRNSKSYDEME